MVYLYRQKGTIMQHTGLALGDGTCVHARGTSSGVVHQTVRDYPWTHWASPWEAENAPEPVEPIDPMTEAMVYAENGLPVKLRNTCTGTCGATHLLLSASRARNGHRSRHYAPTVSGGRDG